MPDGHDVLSWPHIGDPHVTREIGRNHLDLNPARSTPSPDLAKGWPAGSVDLALPPGDNAPPRTTARRSGSASRAIPSPHCRCPVVRAKALGNASTSAVEMRVDDGAWMPMRPLSGDAALWQAAISADASGVTVRARDAKSRLDEDQVEPAGAGRTPPKRQADGSNADRVGADRVGAWPRRGIFGTQLGANRNDRAW